jgi:hypothetical protein
MLLAPVLAHRYFATHYNAGESRERFVPLLSRVIPISSTTNRYILFCSMVSYDLTRLGSSFVAGRHNAT